MPVVSSVRLVVVLGWYSYPPQGPEKSAVSPGTMKKQGTTINFRAYFHSLRIQERPEVSLLSALNQHDPSAPVNSEYWNRARDRG